MPERLHIHVVWGFVCAQSVWDRFPSYPFMGSEVIVISSWAVHVGARLRCVNDLHNYYSGEDDVFLFQIMWMRISLCSHVYATKMSCCSVRKLEPVATKQLFVQLNWSLFLCFDLYVITSQHWCYIHFAHIIQSVYLQDVKIGEKGTEDNFVELRYECKATCTCFRDGFCVAGFEKVWNK